MQISHWIAIGAVILSVILTGLVHVGIREWYQPDVRYEEGSFYRSGDTAVTSLRLQNYGHSDAENLILTTLFPVPLHNISTSEPAYPFIPVSGGLGQKRASGEIERLVPGQVLYVYFAVNDPDISIEDDRDRFVADITFNGGKAKTGEPILPQTYIAAVLIIVFSTIVIGYFVIQINIYNQNFSRHYTDLENAISLGLSARKNNAPSNQLESELETRFGSVRFRKRTLFEVARRAYSME